MSQQLKVWWVPQLGVVEPFYVNVNSVEEAVKIIEVLADYDLFQYNHNVKPDYCNAGDILLWDESEQEWIDWEIEIDGKWFDDPKKYIEYIQSKN